MTAHARTTLDGGCDARYARHECLWGRDADPVAQALAASLRPGAEVLDAGCGEGRNAAFLARAGAHVHAVDVSALALEHAQSSWAGQGAITWEQGDLRTLSLAPGSFDGVLACSVLHWLPGPAAIESALDRFRDATRPGGVNAIAVFNDRVPYAPPAGETHLPCLLPHDWYLAVYADWLLLDASDRDTTGAHAGHAEPHTHAVTRILARRPLEPAPR